MAITNQYFLDQVEQTFSVVIAQEVRDRLQNVGQLSDWIANQWDARPSARHSFSSGASYLLEKAFNELGVLRPISDGSMLIELLPFRGRRKFWSKLAETAELELPELVRPKWIVWLCIGIVASAFFMVTNFFVTRADSQLLALFYGLFVLGFGGMFAHMFSTPFATLPHPDWQNFGMLTKTVIAKNNRLLRDKGGCWTTDEIWFTLAQIVVDSYGLDSDEISRGLSFHEDLEPKW